LVLEKNKATLLDMGGKNVGRTSYRQKDGESGLPLGATLAVGSNDVETSGVVSGEDFDSGRVFLSACATSTSNTLMVSLKTGTSAPFRSVVKGSSLSGPAESGQNHAKVPTLTPLHNPGAPGAVVLGFGRKSVGSIPTVLDPMLQRKLRPHQVEGIQFMFNCLTDTGKDAKYYHQQKASGAPLREARGCILADECGLGKTLQCIGLIWSMLRQGPFGHRHPWCYKAIIVTPSSLVKNWAAEFNKWLGKERMEPIAVSGGGAVAKKLIEEFSVSRVRRVCIVSYEMFRKYAEMFNSIKRLDMMICDEGHRLKCSKGNQTISALRSCKTNRRVILTGTPVQNELNEFYAMVDFVNPNVLGADVGFFQRNFQDPIQRGTESRASESDRKIAEARSKELFKLTKEFIIRRTAEINQKFLPPRNDINIFVRLSRDQEKMYTETVFSALYDRTEPAGTDALRSIHRLRQICTHTSLVNGPGTPQSDISWDAKGKLFVIKELLVQMRKHEPKDRIVLVSNSTKTLDLLGKLCAHLKCAHVRLDGSTQADRRQEIVNAFNSPWRASTSGQPVVFLLSSKAGGCGLNLIGANRLVLVDLDWNPATDQQAAARIWRDGQLKPVFIYRLIATGTIEERIFQRQQMKISSGQGVLKESGSKRNSTLQKGSFSREQLKQLFEYQAGTDCDTYDLLQRSNENESSFSNVPAECGTEWKRYSGPGIIVDPPVREAIEVVGEEVVSWVHVNENVFNTESGSEEIGILMMSDSDESSLDGETVLSKTPRNNSKILEDSSSSDEDTLETNLLTKTPGNKPKILEDSSSSDEDILKTNLLTKAPGNKPRILGDSSSSDKDNLETFLLPKTPGNKPKILQDPGCSDEDDLDLINF